MPDHLENHAPIALDALYLDANNPRLAPEQPPGYTDPAKLFDPKTQEALAQQAEESFDLDSLEAAMVGQGWMPIDSILVWEHPDTPGKFVVVEGNRRLATLRLRILPRLRKAKAKLERMEGGKGKRYSKLEVADQEAEVQRLEDLRSATDPLGVLKVAAPSPDQLDETLNRILAVRHITGPRQWGNYAEDIWLLRRYEDLFDRQHPDQPLRWDGGTIGQVAEEASLSAIKTKRNLRAASAFTRFQNAFEDELPEGEDFDDSDYYLFELIAQQPYARDQFGLGEDTMGLPEDKAQVLFDWVFREPRPNRAEDNQNKFYRHENIRLWGQMKKYDDDNGTGFASRFNVDDHLEAPTMHSVEADYHSHKARKTPIDVFNSLLAHLKHLDAETMTAEGEFLRHQLEELKVETERLLRMVVAAEG
jgi:hypothetical protein